MSKATLFLDTMKIPKHGILIPDGTNWYFRPGRKDTTARILLTDFESSAATLQQTFQDKND